MFYYNKYSIDRLSGYRSKFYKMMYTMHNKFSNFLCFASLCAHLFAMSNYLKCNDEIRILGK